jgi:hypothetical protein
MTKKYILFTASVLLLHACNQNKQGEDKTFTIHIDSKNIVSSIKFSELITDCKYVPLETKVECLIGQLSKIEVFNNEIFTLDSRSARAIYRFSEKGKFLNQIASQGRGPGEYSQPDDISLNANTGEIAILDQIKVLFYKPDNTYLKSVRLPFYSYKIALYDNKIATFSRGDDDLVLMDNNGNQKKVFFRNDDAKRMVMNYPFQLYNEKELLYFAHLDYTVYSILGYKVSPHVKFVFDERMFTDNDIKLLKADPANVNKFVFIKYYNENSTHIFMAYLYMRQPYIVIYDKSNLKTTVIDVVGLQNDITFMREPPIPTGVSADNYFVAYFNYRDVSESDELKKIIGSQADGLDEMSNPVLLFFKFR